MLDRNWNRIENFLDDLLSGSYPSEEAMLARARWMGHDLGRSHVLLAVSLEEPTDRPSGSQRRAPSEAGAQPEPEGRKKHAARG